MGGFSARGAQGLAQSRGREAVARPLRDGTPRARAAAISGNPQPKQHRWLDIKYRHQHRLLVKLDVDPRHQNRLNNPGTHLNRICVIKQRPSPLWGVRGGFFFMHLIGKHKKSPDELGARRGSVFKRSDQPCCRSQPDSYLYRDRRMVQPAMLHQPEAGARCI